MDHPFKRRTRLTIINLSWNLAYSITLVKGISPKMYLSDRIGIKVDETKLKYFKITPR
jgi:hypothetical protein